jgi:hypothetical protein
MQTNIEVEENEEATFLSQVDHPALVRPSPIGLLGRWAAPEPAHIGIQIQIDTRYG